MALESMLVAAGWGLLAGSGIVVGALLGYFGDLSHERIAAFMSGGAGMLLAVLSLDMLTDARNEHGLAVATTGFALGAVAFAIVNRGLARWGAQHRKRCGMCVPQPTEDALPGSGLAIVAGSLLDAVPEGLVVGLGLRATESQDVVLVIGFAISNVPEALSSASGMRLAGRSAGFVLGIWAAVILLTAIAAVVGASIPGDPRGWPGGLLEAFAAGALLAMVVETMVPEAAARGPHWGGVLTALGFLFVLAMLALRGG